MPIAVAGVGVVVVGIVALILLFAFYQMFHPLLVGIAQGGGTVGGLLARFLDNVITAAYNAAFGWARSAVRAVEGFILAPVYWLENNINALIGTLQGVINTLAYIESSLIPRAISAALATARGWVNDAQAYAAGLTATLATWVRAQITALYTYLSAALAAQTAFTLQLFDQAERYTTAAIAAETAYVTQVAGQLTGYVTAGLAQDAAYAEHLFTDALTYTQTLVTDTAAVIDTDIAHVTAWVQQNVTALDAYIASVRADILAFTIGAVTAIEADLGNLKTECTDNLCSNLGPLADLTHSLIGDLGIGALVSLAAAAAADPTGTADTLDTVLGPLATGAAGLYASVTGG